MTTDIIRFKERLLTIHLHSLFPEKIAFLGYSLRDERNSDESFLVLFVFVIDDDCDRTLSDISREAYMCWSLMLSLLLLRSYSG
jgi:hypothetical protein